MEIIQSGKETNSVSYRKNLEVQVCRRTSIRTGDKIVNVFRFALSLRQYVKEKVQVFPFYLGFCDLLCC